ncbi:MAG: hypothetical protein ACRD1R_18280 [Acidobacteriota bacterium]
MIHFRNLNESGSTELITANGPLFSFEYSNLFYGSCTFIARVTEGLNCLILDMDSVVLKNYDLRRGNLTGLEGSARIFFRRILSSYVSLGELDRQFKGEEQLSASDQSVPFLRSLGHRIRVLALGSSYR